MQRQLAYVNFCQQFGTFSSINNLLIYGKLYRIIYSVIACVLIKDKYKTEKIIIGGKKIYIFTTRYRYRKLLAEIVETF